MSIFLASFLDGCELLKKDITETEAITIDFIVADAIKDPDELREFVDLVSPIVSARSEEVALKGYDKFLHLYRAGLAPDLTKVDIPAKESLLNFEIFGSPGITKQREDIQAAFSDMQLPEDLTKSNTLKPEEILSSVKTFLGKEKVKDGVFIYSKEGGSSAIEGIPVVSNLDSLKGLIVDKYLQNKLKKFLVIYKIPVEDTPAEKVAELPSVSTSGENAILKESLLKIAAGTDPAERRALAEELFQNAFTEQFYVKMHRESVDAEPELWDYNDGKNYLLRRLTSEESIKDIQIIKVERSGENGKISHLQLVEIHHN